jgi:hypothetical protein
MCHIKNRVLHYLSSIMYIIHQSFPFIDLLHGVKACQSLSGRTCFDWDSHSPPASHCPGVAHTHCFTSTGWGGQRIPRWKGGGDCWCEDGGRGCSWLLLGCQLVWLGGGVGFTLALLWSSCPTCPFGNRASVSLHSFVGCKLPSTCLALLLWEAFFSFFYCLLVLLPQCTVPFPSNSPLLLLGLGC